MLNPSCTTFLNAAFECYHTTCSCADQLVPEIHLWSHCFCCSVHALTVKVVSSKAFPSSMLLVLGSLGLRGGGSHDGFMIIAILGLILPGGMLVVGVLFVNRRSFTSMRYCCMRRR